MVVLNLVRASIAGITRCLGLERNSRDFLSFLARVLSQALQPHGGYNSVSTLDTLRGRTNLAGASIALTCG